MADILTGWYQNTCSNLKVVGDNHQADAVICRFTGENCDHVKPSGFTVDHGKATLDENVSNTISSCPRLNLAPPQPIKL